MFTQIITKVMIAIALTLSLTLGSGIIEQGTGLSLSTTAQAGNCGSTGGGGC